VPAVTLIGLGSSAPARVRGGVVVERKVHALSAPTCSDGPAARRRSRPRLPALRRRPFTILVLPDRTLNFVGAAMRLQYAAERATVEAWKEGNYGEALVGGLLAAGNSISNLAVGYAVQMVVGAPYNSGFDASTGFQTGDYNRALKGSLEILVLAGGEKLMNPAAAETPSVAQPAEPAAPAARYNRQQHYGGAQTNSPAGRAVRAAGEGQPCPTCTEVQVSGTKTAPVPEHDPSLVEHYIRTRWT
jgi:hypothetical protein